MLKKFKKIGLIVLILFAGIVIGAVIFYAVEKSGLYDFAPPKFLPTTENKSLLNTDMALFWEAISILKDKYVKIGEIKDQDLLYGAVRGLVNSLDDPYSSFFDPEDAKKFKEDIEGSFGGIGAEIGMKNNQLLIVAPLKGNPAEAAGLKAGDKILKVDDTFTNDLTVDKAVKIIRGPVDTEVTLLILRESWNEAKEFKIKRAIIVVPTLDWEMKPGNIAYFHLYNFNANAPVLFYEASFSALMKGTEGIILDLRNNPGGYLEVANNLAGWFLKRGDVIVREKFRLDEENLFRASGPAAFEKIPTVVLINGGSASASEILAGALRDDKAVKLVGEKTFGKGSVQEVAELKDNSSIKISVAEWLTPAGNQIDKKGLVPDFEIVLTDEDTEKNRDPQLDKALEVLKEEISKAGKTLFILGS